MCSKLKLFLCILLPSICFSALHGALAGFTILANFQQLIISAVLHFTNEAPFSVPLTASIVTLTAMMSWTVQQDLLAMWPCTPTMSLTMQVCLPSYDFYCWCLEIERSIWVSD